MPWCFGVPVVNTLVCLLHLHTRLRVRLERPAFPAPSLLRDDISAITRAYSAPREGELLSLRALAKQSSFLGTRFWGRFVALLLVMTSEGCLKFEFEGRVGPDLAVGQCGVAVSSIIRTSRTFLKRDDFFESLCRRTPFTYPLAGEVGSLLRGDSIVQCDPSEGYSLSKDEPLTPILSRKGRGSSLSSWLQPNLSSSRANPCGTRSRPSSPSSTP
jgi:hypothetical protein